MQIFWDIIIILVNGLNSHIKFLNKDYDINNFEKKKLKQKKKVCLKK